MSLNVLQNASKGMVKMEPFPHIILEDALPQHIYDELESTFPESMMLDGHPSVNDDRGHTKRYLSYKVLEDKVVSQIWQEFFSFHVSDEFYKLVTNDIFSDAIKSLYPEQAEQIMNTPSLPRQIVNQARSATPIVTDCQFVMNKPLSENETSRTPHLDNPVEIYAALLYMKKKDDDSIGGDLQLYESINADPRLIGKREADLSTVRLANSCPYKANSLALFLNCRHGVHGVGSIRNQRSVRRSINIIGEYGDGRSVFRI